MQQGAFERLYGAHAGPLLAFLTYRTGDRHLAEDLHADTFERVLRGRAPFDPRRGAEKAWLYTIALNLLRDHQRRSVVGERVTERVAAGLDSDPGSVTTGVEDRDELHAALARLSDEEREAVALRYVADLPLRDIARVTGTPVTTVKGRVHRGLEKLRDELSPP